MFRVHLGYNISNFMLCRSHHARPSYLVVRPSSYTMRYSGDLHNRFKIYKQFFKNLGPGTVFKIFSPIVLSA